MSKLNLIHQDLTKEYQKFNPDMSSKTIRYKFGQGHIEDFVLYGSLTIGLNPYELKCENCFNPRLTNIDVSFTLADDRYEMSDFEFQLTQMGTEVEIKVSKYYFELLFF